MSGQMKFITQFLTNHEIQFEDIKHEPVLTALPPIPELVDLGYCDIKNLLLTTNNSKEEYYLVCSSVYKQFKINNLAKKIGSSRLSFVSKETLYEKLGVYPGIVSILNLIEGDTSNITVILDMQLQNEKMLCFHPNQNNHMYAFTPNDVCKYLDLINVPYKFIEIEE